MPNDKMYGYFYLFSLVKTWCEWVLQNEYSWVQVEEYIELASRKSDLERTELQKEKTGVFSGCYARNPANGSAIPIWVADYVLGRSANCFSSFCSFIFPDQSLQS